MSEEQGGTPSPVESAEQVRAKLAALERMRVAGLVNDRQYDAMRNKLDAQLGMAPPAPPSYAAPPATTPVAPWTPPAPPPQMQPQPRSTLRAPLIATGVILALFAATFAGVAVVSHHDAQPISAATPTGTSAPAPTDTPTPDPAATVAALRNFVPPKGDLTINPAHAEDLVRAFWPVRELGLSQRNPHVIHSIEDGPAGGWDQIGCTFGCPPPSPRAIKDLRVFVPEQKSYPAYFMAQVLTTQYHSSDPFVEIMVFTRKSATVPWYLSFDTSYSGMNHLHESPDYVANNSLDMPVPNDPAIPDRNVLSGMLAAYWQHWKDTGSAPAGTRFTANAFTSEEGQDIYQSRLDDAKDGIAEHVTYSADPATDGLWSFSIDALDDQGRDHQHYVLTCGTVRYRSVDTALAPATSILQDGYEPFGNLLAPGHYATVTEMGLHESCFVTHPGETFIQVEGLDGEQTKVIGVPVGGAGATL